MEGKAQPGHLDLGHVLGYQADSGCWILFSDLDGAQVGMRPIVVQNKSLQWELHRIREGNFRMVLLAYWVEDEYATLVWEEPEQVPDSFKQRLKPSPPIPISLNLGREMLRRLRGSKYREDSSRTPATRHELPRQAEVIDIEVVSSTSDLAKQFSRQPAGIRHAHELQNICLTCGALSFENKEGQRICDQCGSTWYVNHCWSCWARVDSRDPDNPPCRYCRFRCCAVCDKCEKTCHCWRERM